MKRKEMGVGVGGGRAIPDASLSPPEGLLRSDGQQCEPF